VELSGKRVLVVGLGRSGLGAALLCLARGAVVTVTDSRAPADLAGPLERLGGRATLDLGGHSDESFAAAELIVLSPGVPELPQLVAARRRGAQILGELELAYRFIQAPVVAITGTNGKSTTTSLLGAMIEASGRPTFTGGNLGAPLVEAVGSEASGPGGALVLELSSFQLETVSSFRAQVALLLNLSEDHLDRHPSYEAYLVAKARIFERQTAVDFAVINGAPDQLPECLRLLRSGGEAGQTLAFCGARDAALPSGVAAGAWADDEALWVQLPQAAAESVPRALLRLPGRHNLQNALAALLGARLAGAGIDACARGLEGFSGLPHRMELVAEAGGVRYYNDSKATNVGAVVGSLSGFERRVVLIAGGKDKGGDYQPLIPVLQQAARCVVLIGAAADRIAGALQGSGVPIQRAEDLPAAVRLAATLARPSEAVVLSPACSSYDMFVNYEERGRVFARAARDLCRVSGCS
jgi:UDP-N-acetylmuramoylalanine--D-glutamate ligase